MQELLLRLLALFNLVPAGRYHSLAKQFDDTCRGAHDWKTRAGQALQQAKSLEGEVERLSRLLEDGRTREEKRHRAEKQAAELRDQLATTQQALILAREQLMAIEVKLDILEGAANVLDSRTRAVIRRPAETSAGV